MNYTQFVDLGTFIGMCDDRREVLDALHRDPEAIVTLPFAGRDDDHTLVYVTRDGLDRIRKVFLQDADHPLQSLDLRVYGHDAVVYVIAIEDAFSPDIYIGGWADEASFLAGHIWADDAEDRLRELDYRAPDDDFGAEVGYWGVEHGDDEGLLDDWGVELEDAIGDARV